MKYKVQTPNHGVLEIEGPDGATDEQLKAVALRELHSRYPQERFSNTVARPEQPANADGVVGKVADTVRSVANGAFPWADKVSAGVNAVLPIDKLLGKDEASIWDGSSIGDAYRKNLGQEQALTQQGQADSPYMSMAGNVAGAVVSPLSKLIKGAGLARGLGNAAIYGGAAGAGMSEAGSELVGGLKGAVEGAAGQLAGHGLLKGLGHIAEPIVDPVVKRLRAAGVPLTLGRLVPWLKSVEDKAAGTVPVAGDIIKAAQRRSIQGGNTAMANEALAPIGVKIPSSIKPGRKAAAFVQKAAKEAYTDSLTSMASTADDDFRSGLAAAQNKIEGLPAAQADHVKTVMQQDVLPYMDGPVLTGDQLQKVKIGLDGRIAKLNASPHPSDEFAADALNDVRATFMDMAQRQNPELFDKYLNADSAYANVKRFSDAAAKMRSDKEISPLAFAQSVAKKGYGTTTDKVARGDARMQQLSDDLAATLPSSVADSGSGGRIAQLAAGGVALASPVKTAIGATVASLPYLPGVDALLEKIIAGQRPAGVQAAGRGLKKIAPYAGRLAMPATIGWLGQDQ